MKFALSFSCQVLASQHLFNSFTNYCNISHKYRTSSPPMTVRMPKVLEVLASHSYSASSSNTDLWMMRVLCTPLAMISYFFPFRISIPSLNQRTCRLTSDSVSIVRGTMVHRSLQSDHYSSDCGRVSPWLTHETLHTQTWQIPSLGPPHPAEAL